jgi:uncharacterized protein
MALRPRGRREVEAVIVRSSFAVPLPPGEAWRLLLDVREIASCVPGGELKEVVDERTFKGIIRVRLGPVLTEFAGTAQFETLDATTHTAVLKASGNETKGRGSAGARARFQLFPDAQGSRVDIETDLQLAGMVAQYGRASGLIAQMAQQLVEIFAENLRKKIAQAEATTAPARAPEVSALSLFWQALIARLRQAFNRASAK